jgi:L-rhamnose-H+ transport protein
MLIGFALVLLAGLFQGTFVLPMMLVRKWRWEQTWMTFSLLGMLVFNWTLGFLTVPEIGALAVVPARDIGLLVLFGAGWGVGAVLFGLGMERLGMSLGYPVIMGLIACLGTLIPLAVFFPGTLLAPKGLVLLGGAAVALLGIALCSVGGARRQAPAAGAVRRGVDAGGLGVAVLAGILSCFPNLGIAFGGPLVGAVAARGASEGAAANAVWVLFFTAGAVVNCLYCAWLMIARRPAPDYFGPEALRNLRLAALMAALWIGSFYLYGAGSSRLGPWGVVAGWPVFIAVSIGTGVGWGLRRGEWANAPARARVPRNWGLAGLFVAVLLIALSNRF